ncbi:nonribosomal peptide synthase [Aspergillus pseudoviridinutans]|uniref:Nonribosomal peptide synthase n=1 Tax=Aspergillus pseudoviridinutans TaxID=1517512 RepID=A0A9P3EV50_9EURO|nr:nonribosomal peptide synthase [Aspergillus pseudoviridinutans]GIJ86440.1 nonribosomal peptide synthase [Aspergillus pseudoviridinutans]
MNMQEQVIEEIARVLKVSTDEVDVSLNFAHLGGHSLAALQLARACKHRGIEISVGEILQCRSITDLISSARPIQVSSKIEKAMDAMNTIDAIDDFLNPPKQQTTSNTIRYPIPRCLTPPSTLPDSSDSHKVSIPEMQLSLIRGSLTRPDHNILAYSRRCSAHQLPAMREAWQRVLECEEIFRTEFHIEDGQEYLISSGFTPSHWTEITMRDKAAVEVELMQPPSFTGVGWEFRTITIEDSDTAYLLWHVHHALIDGYSMKILLDKVSRVMAGLPVLPGPSFVNVARMREMQIEQRQDEAIAYWKSQKESLENATTEIGLPCLPTSVKQSSFWNGLAMYPVGVTSFELEQYAHSHGVTVASIYYASWALVLSRLCDSDCVLFGAVVSGRSLPVAGILEVVGSLVNTLPIVVTVDEKLDTSAFVKKVFEQIVELAAYDWTVPEHGYHRRVSSALAMQFDVVGQDPCAATQQLPLPSSRMNSEIPLSLLIETDGTICIQYSEQRYHKEQIDFVGLQFSQMVARLLRGPNTVGMCVQEMVSLQDRQALFQLGNCLSASTTETSVDEDLVTLMKKAASNDPLACAVQRLDQTMSYEELDRWSDCVALHLATVIQKGDVVCVHAESSIYWTVAVYSVLKAGGVYCPLNEKLDPELRESMFELSGAAVFLTPSTVETKCRPSASRYCWAVQDLLQQPQEGEEVSDQGREADPAANAYLCFTSGSTGKPKGVLCTHQGLVAFQRDREVRLLAQPGRKIAQIMSLSFDGSIHELFSALSYGATLVLPHPNDPFAHLLEVDTCILTPSLAATMDPSDYPNLATVYLVGEQVTQDVNDRWSSCTTLYNMYGPTEATCGATIKRLLPKRRVTIGRPNPSTRIYILDQHRRLVPRGMTGQIYLAGVQVSNGYLNQPSLTRDRFHADSVCRGLRERMYATGDMGYWNDEGELICLGRNDRQIKLRGFRVDLEDLEARISTIQGVNAAAVTRHEDELIALVQPSSICATTCKERMASMLPAHAIPRYIIPVDRFPMTMAGKLDYKAFHNLLKRTGTAQVDKQMSSTEQRIAKNWSDLLGQLKTKEIFPDSSFVAMGGHSLLQLRLASRLSAEFGRPIPLALIVNALSLRDMARHVGKLVARGCRLATQSGIQMGPNDVSRMEGEWLAKYSYNTSNSSGVSSFNVSFACHLAPSTDRNRLCASWDKVMADHPILQSRYPASGRMAPARVYSHQPPKAQFIDELDERAEINRPFHVDREDLIRVFISPTLMLVVVSHLICDLTTMRLLLKQVENEYHGKGLQQASIPYETADAWKRQASDEDLAFWTTYLKDAPYPESQRRSYNGRSRLSIIPKATSHAVTHFVQTSPFTHHQLAIAAVALALNTRKDRMDVLLGGPFANRWSENDMNTIGLFLEPLPIRIQFDADHSSDAQAFLQSVLCSSQAALSHAVPWQDLLCHLGVTPGYPNHPLFETVVTFHERQDALTFALDDTTTLLPWSNGAKFGLMCEFTALPDGRILLRLEYDDTLWDEVEIGRIERSIATSLELFAQNTSYADIIDTLRGIAEQPLESLEEQPDALNLVDYRLL